MGVPTIAVGTSSHIRFCHLSSSLCDPPWMGPEFFVAKVRRTFFQRCGYSAFLFRGRKNHDRPWVLWSLGPLVPWSSGLLVLWSSGQEGCPDISCLYLT